MESYSGPIPPPAELQNYELIQPGFADRLISMAEKEQNNRLNLTRLQIESEIKLQTRDQKLFVIGQILAFASVLSIVLLCGYAFYLGAFDEGKIIAVSVIIGLAGLFIVKRNSIFTKKL